MSRKQRGNRKIEASYKYIEDKNSECRISQVYSIICELIEKNLPNEHENNRRFVQS